MQRAMSWALLITLVVGFLGATASAAAGSLGCCAHACPDGAGHCEWMTPAGCCDDSPLVPAPNAAPMPAITVALRSTLGVSATPHSTPGHASSSPQRVYFATVVLRL